MKLKTIKSLVIGLMLCCSFIAEGQIPNFDNDVFTLPDADESSFKSSSADCSKSSSAFQNKYGRYDFYIPNINTPIKTIKINLNIFQKSDGTGNLQNNSTDLTNLNQMVQWINDYYTFIKPPSDPIPGVPFISDSRIRFEVVGIYFYQNDELNISTDKTTAVNYIKSIDPSRMEALNIWTCYLQKRWF